MPQTRTEGATRRSTDLPFGAFSLDFSPLSPIQVPGTACADVESVTPSRQARLVLAIFIVTQVLDGALTYWGVSRFGVQIEFNSWLASLMTAVGPAPALLAAKAVACGCGFVLFVTTSFRVLAVATGWCLGFAVVPWVALAFAFA